MKSRRRSCVRSTASPEKEKEKKSKHFMKAILPSPIHHNQIRIPDEFIRRFGNELSNAATITVPDGSIWKITLKKCGKDVFFCNNWQQFTQYYDIGYGSYLSFKYKGNSNFSVIIFDATSVEICYPSTNEEPNTKSPTPSPKKRSKVETTEKNHETKFISASKRAKDAANQFYPKSPFFRSTLNKNRYPYVASNFAEKYLLSNVPIKLQNSHGQQWEVSCVLNMGRTFGMRLTSGFCEYKRDNNLSLGDTCVFELIKTKPVVVLLVTEFRSDDYCH